MSPTCDIPASEYSGSVQRRYPRRDGGELDYARQQASVRSGCRMGFPSSCSDS